MTFPFVMRPQRAVLDSEAAIAALSPAALLNPSDPTSLYIAHDGQTQASADNDPVGLWLDKSQMGGKPAAQFITDQPELTTNGGFDDASWWSTDAGWSISAGGATATAANDQVYSPMMIDAGKTYRVSVELKSYTSGSFRAVIAGNVYELPATFTNCQQPSAHIPSLPGPLLMTGCALAMPAAILREQSTMCL